MEWIDERNNQDGKTVFGLTCSEFIKTNMSACRNLVVKDDSQFIILHDNSYVF